ncbi:MAG TPA: hypothetical protein VHM01_15530 [Alphaproteobacteria bacterium]|nr:hypothetical protein [Alphaproteobacteria bacterium]
MAEDDFEAELEKSLERADAAFRGKYKKELQELLASSAEDLGIKPTITDAEIYSKLISTVKAASAANISQAELKDRIVALGRRAVVIAKRVSRLAALFA